MRKSKRDTDLEIKKQCVRVDKIEPIIVVRENYITRHLDRPPNKQKYNDLILINNGIIMSYSCEAVSE